MPLFQIGTAGGTVPAGTYSATFQGIESGENARGAYHKWAFRTDDGKTITAFSDGSPPTTKNRTGRFLSALSGQPLTAGVEVNTDAFIGQRYTCVVVPHNATTRLETFTKA